MSPRLRLTLSIVSLLSLASFGLASSSLAAAQTTVVTSAPLQNVVNLQASATVEVTKDQLTIVFSTTREGTDANQVQSQLKAALDQALAEARKAARPGQVDVQTGNFALYPRYTARGLANGFAGTAEMVVSGQDLGAISQLAGRINTLTVARTSFGLSREAREKIESEVSAQAIAGFKGKAEQVARQFGFGGWSLREVQVTSGDSPMQPVFRQAMRAASADEAALPIEAGKAAVTVTVSGSVQLSPR